MTWEQRLPNESFLNRVEIDLGYGESKSSNGLCIPSVLGQTVPLSGKIPEDPSQHIIYRNGIEEYFVGDLAIRQSPFQYSSTPDEKAVSKEAEVIFKTLLALSTSGEKPIDVTTGLPVSVYFTQKQRMENLMKGEHITTVQYGHTTITRHTHVKSVFTVPQPLGSFYYWMQHKYDKDGKLLEQYKSLLDGVIVVLDIGFLTADALAIDGNNETILREHSYSTEGIIVAIRAFKEAIGSRLPMHKLGREIRKPQYADAAKRCYSGLAGQLIAETTTFWRGMNPKLILITGGGGAALSHYLQRAFPGSILVSNPSMANVLGYKIIGEQMFRGT